MAGNNVAVLCFAALTFDDLNFHCLPKTNNSAKAEEYSHYYEAFQSVSDHILLSFHIIHLSETDH